MKEEYYSSFIKTYQDFYCIKRIMVYLSSNAKLITIDIYVNYAPLLNK